MSEFEKAFLKRHNEASLMPLIEQWERMAKVQHDATTPFEERWTNFLHATSDLT